MAERISRRNAMKLGALGALSAGLHGCRPSQSGDQPPARDLTAPTGLDDAAWAPIRAEFTISPEIAYMNNASLGMPPGRVVEAVAAGYAAISSEPLHGKHGLQERIANEVMPQLGAFFGARPEELSLTRNATEALHLQTQGLRLRSGDEVLITSQEHPAGRRPWQFRAEREGVLVTEVFIPSPLPSADEILERFESAIRPSTRAIAFCHVTRGGHLYPVEAMCTMARDRGLVSLVDGAQAVGQMSVDLRALGCDAYSASLHKWMLGPVGSGFMFVSENARERIATTYAPDATPITPQLAPPGTADFPIRAAIGTALEFATTLGLDRIEARCRHLSDYLKERLDQVSDVRPLSGHRGQSAPGQTIFEKVGLDAVSAVPLIEEAASVHIDEHQRDGHNAIRVSTHVYNTKAEIDRLVEVLGVL